MKLNHVFIALFLSISFGPTALSDVSLTVTEKRAEVVSRPSSDGNVIGRLNKGKILDSSGKKKNGFYLLKNKSNRQLWISESDVEVSEDYSLDADLEQGKAAESASGDKPRFKRLTLDFGGSIGKRNGNTFFEINAGLEYFFLRWLSWRNAPFYRAASSSQDLYGLDSSIKARTMLGEILLAHLGLGYRFASDGEHAPIGEVGLTISQGGFRFGGAIKMIAHEFIDSTRSNEFLFSIILSGRTSII